MKIYYYETSTGNSPIKKFINSLPEADQARFVDVHKEIEKHGLQAVRLTFKPIEGKLWEIKFSSVNSGYRIFYIIIEKEMMVWLHAFKKKSNQTPKQELEISRKRMKEILK